jgi:hypothetical protein
MTVVLDLPTAEVSESLSSLIAGLYEYFMSTINNPLK